MAPVTNCGARVSSVEEFLNEVDQVYNTLCDISLGNRCELWFRGQVRSDFSLLPRIARPPWNNATLEDAFLSKFSSLAIPFVQNLPAFPLPEGVPTYWSWLVIMQHYGVATRLLDWTRYALAALFFATNPEDTSRNPQIDGTVWVLNPVTLNKAFNFNPNLQSGFIPNMVEPEFTAQFGPQSQFMVNLKPTAAIAPVNNPNILAQRGTFTVYPLKKNLQALETFDDASNFLFKICIASESFDLIQTQLRRFGITKLALFPSLENIAGEISAQIMNENIQPTNP